MKPTAAPRSASLSAVSWWPSLFFVAVFLFLWLRVQPCLEYFLSAFPFYWKMEFFQPFLATPGGPLRGLYRLVSQANYLSWLGALVFTGLGALIFWVAGRLGRCFHCSLSPWLRFPPLFLFLVLFNWHPFLIYETTIGFLIGLAFALAFVRLCASGIWRPTLIGPGMAALLYYLTGMGPLILFTLLASLWLPLRRSQWLQALLCVLSAILITVAWSTWGGFDWQQAFMQLGEAEAGFLVVTILLYYPLVLVFTWGWDRFKERHPPAPPGKPAHRKPPSRWSIGPWRSVYRWTFRATSLLAGIAAVGMTLDSSRQELSAIDYYGSTGQWDRIPPLAVPLRVWSSASRLNTHLALYHQDRLLEDLFRVFQQKDLDLLPQGENSQDLWRALCHTLIELGQVNLAEHYLYEALELAGDYPELLAMAAQIHLLKGHPQAARVYLNWLRTHPVYHRQAQSMLRDLDSRSSQDTLAANRAFLVKTDFASSSMPTEVILRQALHSNPRNKMAFEYLIALYLLESNSAALIKELKRFEDFPYSHFPRAVEEALLLHPEKTLSLGKFRIRPETASRFAQFKEVMSQGSSDTGAATPAAMSEFCDTYWYYELFGKSMGHKSPRQP